MTRIFASIALLAALAACETVEGAGQDISGAGQAISSTANEAQADM